MKQLDDIRNWYDSLPGRERLMVSGASVVVVITLFYLIVWEPIYKGLDEEISKQATQQEIISWMRQAAGEVRTLRASGASNKRSNSNAPVTLTLEQTAASSGIKSKLSKLESSGKNSARARLDNVAFNQMMLWINTVEQSYGIIASSVTIENTDKPGIVNARLSFSRDT
jgi:general secretion pathway protein M